MSRQLSLFEISCLQNLASRLSRLCQTTQYNSTITQGVNNFFSSIINEKEIPSLDSKEHITKFLLAGYSFNGFNVISPFQEALTHQNYTVIEAIFANIKKLAAENFAHSDFAEFSQNIARNIFAFYLQPQQQKLLDELLSNMKDRPNFKEFFANFVNAYDKDELTGYSRKILEKYGFLEPEKKLEIVKKVVTQDTQTDHAQSQNASTQTATQTSKEKETQTAKITNETTERAIQTIEKNVTTGSAQTDLRQTSETAAQTENELVKQSDVVDPLEIVAISHDDFRLVFFNTFYYNLLFDYHSSEARDEEQKQQLFDLADFFGGKKDNIDFNPLRSNLINLPYDEFTRFAEMINYHKESEGEEEPAKETIQVSRIKNYLLNQILYFTLKEEALPLWLQEEIAHNGGLEEVIKTIYNPHLKKIIETTRPIKLLTKATNPTLQNLLDSSANFDEIQDFVNKNITNKDLVTISSIRSIITDPQSDDICEFLQKHKLLSEEVRNAGFEEAIMMGAFNFAATKTDLLKKYLDSDKFKKRIISSPAWVSQTFANEEKQFLVNCLKTLMKSRIKTPQLIEILKGSKFKEKKTLTSYLIAALSAITPQHIEESSFTEIKKFLQIAKEIAEEKNLGIAIIAAIRTAAISNLYILVPFLETVFSAIKSESTLNEIKLSLVVNTPNPLRPNPERLQSDLNYALENFALAEDVDNFKRVLQFIQKNFKEEGLSFVLISSPNITHIIAENIPDFIKDYYENFVKNLVREKRGKIFTPNESIDAILSTDINREERVYCNNNFLTDCIIASNYDLEFIKTILADIKQTVSPQVFYIILNLTRQGEEKNAQELILEKAEGDDKSYFENLFADARTVMLETQQRQERIYHAYQKAVGTFSGRFVATLNKEAQTGAHITYKPEADPGHVAAKMKYFKENNLIFRIVQRINKKNIQGKEAELHKPELLVLSPPDLRDLLWHFLDCNVEDLDSLALVNKKPSFAKAKATGQISKQQEIAIELLLFSLRSLPVPLWMKVEVEKNGGLDAIKATITNPTIKLLLNDQTQDPNNIHLEFAKKPAISKNTTLKDLILAGVDLETFKEFYKISANKQKPLMESFDKPAEEILFPLLLNPDCQKIVGLIESKCTTIAQMSDFGVFIHELFLCALANGDAKFLEERQKNDNDNFQKLLLLPLREDRNKIKENSSFTPEKILLPFYKYVKKLDWCVFNKPNCQGLFEHMEKAATIHPPEFIEYLEKSQTAIGKNDFKKLLEGKFGAEGKTIIQLVQDKCPQKLEELQRIYTEALGADKASELFKTEPAPSPYDTEGHLVRSELVESYHGV